MYLATVVGDVVSTHKNERLEGKKLLLVQRLDLEMQPEGVEVIALDGSPRTWLGGLLRGRFSSLPAMRLRGHAGPRRPATEEEQERWQRKVRRLRFTKGHALLWRDMTHARDLRFDAYDPIRLGAMTQDLFPEPD